jgi:hypothetical protein
MNDPQARKMTFNSGRKAFYAQGRLKRGQMNKTEAAYALNLDRLKRLGDVLWWRFEGLKLRLADNTFYTPDFAVMRADCVIECHEVKGFWQDDARAKIKIAAELYPFRFKAFKAEAKKRGGGWLEESFGEHDNQPHQAPMPLPEPELAAHPF